MSEKERTDRQQFEKVYQVHKALADLFQKAPVDITALRMTGRFPKCEPPLPQMSDEAIFDTDELASYRFEDGIFVFPSEEEFTASKVLQALTDALALFDDGLSEWVKVLAFATFDDET